MFLPIPYIVDGQRKRLCFDRYSSLRVMGIQNRWYIRRKGVINTHRVLINSIQVQQTCPKDRLRGAWDKSIENIKPNNVFMENISNLPTIGILSVFKTLNFIETFSTAIPSKI